jgi:hypothetical protein
MEVELMPEQIPVLAVRQPWTTMINLGWKPWEVRTQKTKKRGTIALYASRSKPKKLDMGVYHNMKSCCTLEEMTDYHVLDYGKIIGLADLVDCKQFESEHEFIVTGHNHLNPHEYYQDGLWYWILKNIRHVEPIDFKFCGSVVWSSIDRDKLQVIPGTNCIPEVHA